MITKENIFTVTEINLHIKNIIENKLPTFYIEGEIANFTRHSSGHIYFSLKDKSSTIKAVFFKGYNSYLQFSPKNGDKVVCGGKITVYDKSGSYQLNVNKMIPYGKGELQLLFEQLKEKLSNEGLFDPENKLKLPKFPSNIGVVTSKTGAAFQDICNVLKRRYPVNIILYPANVQGEKAAKSIIDGINYFNTNNNVDIIIVGRGGGSQEDLFCFNDENIARTIFKSKIPVISAVGHEIDFTISDFVADLRAPTPSVAAELAVPDKEELLDLLEYYQFKLENLIEQKIVTQKNLIKNKELKLLKYKPEEIIKLYENKIDNFNNIINNIPNIIKKYKENFLKIENSFNYTIKISFTKKITEQREKLNESHKLIYKTTDNYVEQKRKKLYYLSQMLDELSPETALKRGYSIIFHNKKIINSIKKLEDKKTIKIRMSDGEITCQINKIKKFGVKNDVDKNIQSEE